MSITSADIQEQVRANLVALGGERRKHATAFLLSLAQELAMEITPPLDVLKAHGLNKTEFDDIARMPMFQTMYSEAMVAWGATSSAPVRIKAKMEHMVEQSLPEIFKELQKEGLSGPKVELIKAMMKGSGIGEQTAKEVGREGVTINIDMSAAGEIKKVPVITIDHNANEA